MQMKLIVSVVLCAAFAASAQAADAPPVGNAAAGYNKTFHCVGCHEEPGYRMAYPVIYSVPKLGGQHAQYLSDALHEYKSGARSSTTMQAIAADLTEQDIADLAAYFSGEKNNNGGGEK